MLLKYWCLDPSPKKSDLINMVWDLWIHTPLRNLVSSNWSKSWELLHHCSISKDVPFAIKVIMCANISRTSPDGQCWNQIVYVLCSQRWRISVQSAKTTLGGDCGSDHELLIAKFRLKLKKVGKTTRPFRYDLNQNPYDYTVEVRNRFKELDLIDSARLTIDRERFVILYRRQVSRPSPRKRNAEKTNWLSEEVLQIAVKRGEVKSKGEKEIYTIECRVPKKSKER